MLMHQADRAGRRDGASVGTNGTESDVRKRRLAGAVFTDQCMNTARVQFQVDPVDRDDAGVSFANGMQRKGGPRRV